MIAVNDAYRRAPWADVLYACDRRWWAKHAEGVRDFAGIKVTGWLRGSGPLPTEQADVRVLLLSGEPRAPGEGWIGWHHDPSGLRHGSNSGFQAMHLAGHFGAARILLLGFDMQGKHFFGDHPGELNQGQNFALFIQAFERAAPVLKELGIEVIQTTPDSALQCFPYRPLEEVIA